MTSAGLGSPIITACIFSHNGGTRLASLFSALTRQTLAFFQWEVLVLDLGSTDDTREVARRQLLGKCGGRGRVVRVEQPGLAWARARAAREACGEIICFLEDDQHPAPDFLAAVVQAFAEHPRAGVMGGRISPAALTGMAAPLALRLSNLGDLSRCLEDRDAGIAGAGLCIRRSVCLSLASAPAPDFQRAGSPDATLIHALDFGISAGARQLGWQCWYVPDLRIPPILPVEKDEKPGPLQLNEPLGHPETGFRPLGWLKEVTDYCCWHLRQWRRPSSASGQPHPARAGDPHPYQSQARPGRVHPVITGNN